MPVVLRSDRSDSDPAGDYAAAPIRPGTRLLCSRCGLQITDERSRTVVQGGHEHRCTNPQGIDFHIGCFDDARGCMEVGEPRMEHTWFSGFSWQITICRSCGEHLGWRFHKASGRDFYGLVLARLLRAA